MARFGYVRTGQGTPLLCGPSLRRHYERSSGDAQPVRTTALGLMRQGRLMITKKGKPVDPSSFKGVIRLRLPTAEESEQLIQARTATPDDAD